MELKLFFFNMVISSVSCFNRTFMELKLFANAVRLDIDISFNRTFMELKFTTVKKFGQLMLF